MSGKSSKYKKTKTFEVSPRSLFRASEMDRTIQKWEKMGWELAEKKKTSGGKYKITLEYYLSEEEIAAKKRQDNVIGCGVLIVIGLLITSQIPTWIRGSQEPPSTATVERESVAIDMTDTSSATERTPVAIRTPGLQPTVWQTTVIHPSDTPRPTQTSLPSAVVAADQSVNLRASDSTNSAIVTSLDPGTTVTVLKSNGDASWFHVRTADGREGWIASFLLDVGAVSALSSSNTAVCRPNMRLLGGPFRYENSYEDETYSSYSYSLTTRSDYQAYGVSVSVGEEWAGVVIPITATFDGYQGKIVIDGIVVSYLYEGTLGSDEGLFFSFEYGGLKYSGDVSIIDDMASESFRNQFHEDLEMFIRVLTKC